MSYFQFILLAVGAFIVLTSFDLTKIGPFLKSLIPVPTPTPVPVPNTPQNNNVVPTPTVPVSDSDKLVEVVQKWTDLKEVCEQNGLQEAVTKLNEIFPVLIKADK